MATIHPTAIVDSSASIGDGCEIGPGCVIGGDVVLEQGVVLDAYVRIEGRTRLGADTRVAAFAALGGPPQDRKDAGAEGRLEIGPRCVIREHVTMHRGTGHGGGVTRVGADSYYMVGSHVGHDCRIGARVMLTNNAVLGGHVEVGDDVIVGGNSAVHQFCRIGSGAFIAGMCGVWADVIPNGYAIGDRARLEGLNVVGLRRRGWERARILAFRRAYRFLFQGDGAFAARRAALTDRFEGDADVAAMAEFIAAGEDRPLLHPRRDEP